MMNAEVFIKKIDKLESEKAKALLKLTYIGLDMAVNGTRSTEEMREILKELFDMYKEIEV